jgi:cytochrome P450
MRDQRTAYDGMRRRCPVASSEFLGWSLFRHEDVTRALHDHETFSNAVSQHLSVPNGMDLPEHTGEIAPVPEKSATLAVFPASGFATLPLRIR